jgi:hypothetical protein
MNRGSILRRGRSELPFTLHPDSLWGTPIETHNERDLGALSSQKTWAGHEVTATGEEVKNTWSYT